MVACKYIEMELMQCGDFYQQFPDDGILRSKYVATIK
jgi:hypothetical protein